MFSLPSLAPQDAHTLWYTSSTSHPSSQHNADYEALLSSDPQNARNRARQNPSNANDPNPAIPNSTTIAHLRRNRPRHRSPLTRLRLDEEYLERRKKNISNYGNSWLKPPGVSKTLYQQREEKRELEEHQEAIRREQLAQELFEAEEEDNEELASAVDGEEQVLREGANGIAERDLDDDVPDANATPSVSSEESTSEDEEEDDEDGQDSDGEGLTAPALGPGYVPPDRALARIEYDSDGEVIPTSSYPPPDRFPARLTDDDYRQTLSQPGAGALGADGFDDNEFGDDENPAEMLQEEDLIQRGGDVGIAMDGDIDMDADLDADIPDADASGMGGYEHTDTEEELESSDVEDDDESVDGGRLPLAGNRGITTSMVRSDGTQTSMDLSSIISSGNSLVGSSPQGRIGLRGRR